jgi:hypothetical protein
MFVLETIPYALDSQSYEQQIREGIDDFGGIDSGVVILFLQCGQQGRFCKSARCHTLAPVDG